MRSTQTLTEVQYSNRSGKLPTLRANFTSILGANVLYAACQWLMLIVLARSCSTEMMGLFALSLAVCAPVSMFFYLQLKSIQVIDTRQSFQFSDYFSLRLMTTIAALATVTGITVVAGYSWRIAGVIIATGISKSLDGISDVIHGLLQQQERMTLPAKSISLKGVLSLLLFAFGVCLTRDVFWGVCGLALGSALMLIFYDMPMCRQALARLGSTGSVPQGHSWLFRSLCSTCRGKRMIQILRMAVPLGCVQMLVSFNANVPRYFVEHHLGSRELGIFAAMAYFVVPGQTVVAALGHSISPRLARYFVKREYRQFWRLIVSMVGLGALLGLSGLVVAVFLGARIVAILYPIEYTEYTDVLVPVMASAAISYIAWFLGFGMNAARIIKAQVPLIAATTVATSIAAYWLIPSGGIKAAATAMCLGMAVQVVGSVGLLFHTFHKQGRPIPVHLHPKPSVIIEF